MATQIKKLVVLSVRHGADTLPSAIRERLLKHAGVENAEDEAIFERTDPATPDEALVDSNSHGQVADLVINHLRPDPLPFLLLENGHVVTFMGKDGVLMRLKGIKIEAEPFFEEDRPQSAGDLIEEHHQPGDSACG